jgi:hypothetical protein
VRKKVFEFLIGQGVNGAGLGDFTSNFGNIKRRSSGKPANFGKKGKYVFSRLLTNS